MSEYHSAELWMQALQAEIDSLEECHKLRYNAGGRYDECDYKRDIKESKDEILILLKKFRKWVRELCFESYNKECFICQWNIVVDVHHMNENHDDNNIENLIPLCPNHHRMIHMYDYKDELREKILSSKYYILNRV